MTIRRPRSLCLPAAPKLLYVLGLLSILCSGLTRRCAVAGGGPENVFVVVNSRSWSSRTVANYFAAIRDVPPSNLYCLDWGGNNGTGYVAGFRSAILNPVIREIQRRELTGQIDYVVYSTDFPIRIYYHADRDQANLDQKFPGASITGLTFLHRLVRDEDAAGYTQYGSNWYMPRPASHSGSLTQIPRALNGDAQGFRSSYAWSRGGVRVADRNPHRKYLLSTTLAHTSGDGNSLVEVIRYLQRSSQADGTQPSGTIYFMRSGDVRRSRVRESSFASAIKSLRDVKVAASEENGVLPRGSRRVQGLTTGTANFDWASSGSRILPGAICDNFTSFGGALFSRGNQTRLTEFLRHGAAGASGTVIEPYALWWKFPHPAIHGFYAKGCSLAEAFYQSVYAPYQLLIVGDPLCQPWAKTPTVKVDGVAPGDTLTGKVSLTPSAMPPEGYLVDHFEFFIDGIRRKICGPGGTLELDTRELADGYHELRIVAVESSPIETQGRVVIPINVANRRHTISLRVNPSARVTADSSLTLTAKSSSSKEIVFYHNAVRLGHVAGPSGTIRVEAGSLGFGPVEIRAVGVGGNGDKHTVNSKPVQVMVQTQHLIAPLRSSRLLGRPRRLQLRLASGKSLRLGKTTNSNWIEKAGVKLNEPFEIVGHIQTPEQGLYQFQFAYQGELNVQLNNTRLHDGEHAQRYEYVYLPVVLKKGVYRLQVRGRLLKLLRFHAAFGTRGTSSLHDPSFAVKRF